MAVGSVRWGDFNCQEFDAAVTMGGGDDCPLVLTQGAARLADKEKRHVRRNPTSRAVKIRGRRHERPVQRPCRRPCRGRGVRLHAGRTGLHPRRGEHGPVVRQPHGDRQPAARRSRRGPGLRRWPRRVPGGGEGRADRQGHRHRHDPEMLELARQNAAKGEQRASRSRTSSSIRRPSTSCRCRTPRWTA